MTEGTLLNGLAVLVVVTVTLSAQESQPTPPDDRESGWAGFRVLTERNIFLRDRAGPRPGASSGSPRTAVVRDPYEDHVLTGAVRHGVVAIAFVEDVRTGDVKRLREGDVVGDWKIRAISLNGMEYSREGTTRKIEIGQSLAGWSAALPAAAASTAAEAGKRSTSAAQPSDNSTASVLERMRQRRQQELKK